MGEESALARMVDRLADSTVVPALEAHTGPMPFTVLAKLSEEEGLGRFPGSSGRSSSPPRPDHRRQASSVLASFRDRGSHRGRRWSSRAGKSAGGYASPARKPCSHAHRRSSR